MPKSLNPNERLVMVLACDQELPRETQPRFFAKPLTVAGIKKVQQLATAGSTDAIIDAVMMCLTGWENMDREFTANAVADVLTIGECTEIIEFCLSGGKLDGAEKKKSV